MLVLATPVAGLLGRLDHPRRPPDVHAQARELLDGHAITVPGAFTGADLTALDGTGRLPTPAWRRPPSRPGTGRSPNIWPGCRS